MRSASFLVAALLASANAPSTIELPGAGGRVGFDDLVFSRELHRLLAPAGRTGRLDLVDPASGAVEAVEGFSQSFRPAIGHGQGPTSADAGQGFVFATDRTSGTLVAVDPRARRIVARIKLGAGPDYVRWVGATREVWVTEPDRESIEVFSFEPGPSPAFKQAGIIAVPGGPESLVVDAAGGRAYTNSFGDATFAIEVASHRVAARWTNRCRGARGIALDAARRVVFVGCDEGKAISLDVARGVVLGETGTGDGVDSIAYDPQLSHLYVPAGGSANLTVLAVKGSGALEALGTIPTAPGAHCVATDDRGNIYVCDPGKGRLLVFHDPYPASSR